MIYTDFGEFDLIQNYRDAFVLDDFIHRYVECFDRYMYIVGDYSSGLLRLKGFNNLGKGNSKKNIPDYIFKWCAVAIFAIFGIITLYNPLVNMLGAQKGIITFVLILAIAFIYGFILHMKGDKK